MWMLTLMNVAEHHPQVSAVASGSEEILTYSYLKDLYGKGQGSWTSCAKIALHGAHWVVACT